MAHWQTPESPARGRRDADSRSRPGRLRNRESARGIPCFPIPAESGIGDSLPAGAIPGQIGNRGNGNWGFGPLPEWPGARRRPLRGSVHTARTPLAARRGDSRGVPAVHTAVPSCEPPGAIPQLAAADGSGGVCPLRHHPESTGAPWALADHHSLSERTPTRRVLFPQNGQGSGGGSEHRVPAPLM